MITVSVVDPGVRGVVAVIVTVFPPAPERSTGAVYCPTSASFVDGTIVPVAAVPPATPFTRYVITGVVPLAFVGFEKVTINEKLLISPAGTLAVVGLNVSSVTCTVPPVPPQPVTPSTLATAIIASAKAEILLCIYQTPLICFAAVPAIVSSILECLRNSKTAQCTHPYELIPAPK
jgi:hypothetical protein